MSNRNARKHKSASRVSARNSVRRSSHQLKLRIEPLEARRLLAAGNAAISVSVYLDQDLSRDYQESADLPAVGRLVYLDLNQNGSFDPADLTAVTDSRGMAFFEELAAGDYSVGLVTNHSSQLQSEPVRIESSASIVSNEPVRLLLADRELEYVFGVLPTDNGTDSLVRLVSDGRPLSEGDERGLEIELPGHVTSHATGADGGEWLIIDTDAGQRVGILDVESGEFQLLEANLGGADSSSGRIEQLVRSGDELVGLLSHPTGHELVLISRGSNGITASRSILTRASAISGTADNSILHAVFESDFLAATDSSRILSLDVQNGFAQISQTEVPANVSALSRFDGRELLFAETDQGIWAFDTSSGTPTLVATLAEAAGPISAKSADGRLLTGSVADPTGLISWDTSDWTIIERSSAINGLVTALETNTRGDQALVVGTYGVQQLGLAVASLERVSLPDNNSTRSLRMGVQKIRENSPPQVPEQETREVVEDNQDRLVISDLGIVDSDGDYLWYTIETSTSHGQLVQQADGTLVYTPRPDFAGSDSARLLVHDGQSTATLSLSWEILPVNDPPISINVESDSIPEDSAAGTGVGFVSIVDPDPNADYRVTSSDSRFRIENGRIYLESSGFDFESESSVVINVLAVDSSDSSITISTEATLTIADVNEPPTDIRLSSSELPENVSGALVGTVAVEDPDAASDYDFSVFDDRFEIVDGQLKLVDGAEVDFESESELSILVTATDRNSGFSITRARTITVRNGNDLPTGIVLSRRNVEEATAGAIVGELSVIDPDGDFYSFSVSDARFEVVDGNSLKLLDSVEIEPETLASISIGVTAIARNGDQVSQQFSLNVIEPISRHHNPAMPSDVNGDGAITPLDALLIINDLNLHGSRPLNDSGTGNGEAPVNRPDVNNDGILSPLDVLLIINDLNESAREGEGEKSGFGSAAESDLQGAFAPLSVSTLEDEHRRAENEKLDSELEMLLDQMSREKLR